MSHCDDEHESASSGARHKRDETGSDRWEVWKMSLWTCFKDKLFLSGARYKSCCDEKGRGGAAGAEVALTGTEQLENKTQSGIQAETFILLRSPSGFWCDFWSPTSPSRRAGLEGSSANFKVSPRVQPELCCRGNGRHMIGGRVNQIFVTSQPRTTASIKGFLWRFCSTDLFVQNLFTARSTVPPCAAPHVCNVAVFNPRSLK